MRKYEPTTGAALRPERRLVHLLISTAVIVGLSTMIIAPAVGARAADAEPPTPSEPTTVVAESDTGSDSLVPPTTELDASDETDVTTVVAETSAPETTPASSTDVTTTTVAASVNPTPTTDPPTTDLPTASDVPSTTDAPSPSTPSQTTDVGAMAIATPVVSSLHAAQSEQDSASWKDRIVSISWTGTADYYDVDRRLSTASSWRWVEAFASSPLVDTFDEQIDTLGWYQYRVTPYSLDPDTYEYVYGAPAYVSVLVEPLAYPPSVPRSIQTAVASTSATISWQAPTTADYECEGHYYYCDPATSYVVSWAASGGAWRSVTTTATSRTLTALASGTTYWVNVRAVNAAGSSSATASIHFTPFTAPAAITQMQASIGDRSVTLRWTTPTDGGASITRYAIQRRVGWTSPWEYVTYDVAGSERSYVARYLTPGTYYQFRIVAFNAAGMGAWSNPVGITARSAPGAVPALRSTSGSSRLTLTWGTPTNGGLALRSYRVEAWNGYSWRLIGTTSYRSMNLFNAYGCGYLRVAAVNSAGVGAYSSIYVCGATTPGAVPSLRAASGYSSIFLSWSTPSNGGDALRHYRVEVWNGSYWRLIGTTTTRSMMVVSVYGCWTYRVAAVNGAGTGTYSYVYACGW